MECVEEYLEVLTIVISIGIFLLNTHMYDKAIGLFKEYLVLLNNDGMKTMQVLLDVRKQLTFIVYSRLGTAYNFINDFTSAIDYYTKALTLAKEMKNRKKESAPITATLKVPILKLVSTKRRLNIPLKRLRPAKRLGTNERRASTMATWEASTNVSVIIPDVWNITKDRSKLTKNLAGLRSGGSRL